MEALRKDYRYTYLDYASWETGERYELIDGIPYMMSPAPSIRHQSVSRELFLIIGNFLEGNPCQVFHAPIDVCLFAEGDNDDTVVQPDIIVVCDRLKLDGKRCNGAPDIIIEILSPSSAVHDRVIKFKKYQQAGVREYWIIDPAEKSVFVHILENGKYVTSAYSDTDTVPVHMLYGCEIDLQKVFKKE